MDVAAAIGGRGIWRPERRWSGGADGAAAPVSKLNVVSRQRAAISTTGMRIRTEVWLASSRRSTVTERVGMR
jgi:hypothetical protein